MQNTFKAMSFAKINELFPCLFETLDSNKKRNDTKMSIRDLQGGKISTYTRLPHPCRTANQTLIMPSIYQYDREICNPKPKPTTTTTALCPS